MKILVSLLLLATISSSAYSLVLTECEILPDGTEICHKVPR